MGKKLVWFRQDIRVNDNPALHHAAKSGEVIAIYIEAKKQREQHHEAKAKVGLIYDSLLLLREALNKLNIPLHIMTCDYFTDQTKLIKEVIEDHDVDAVFFNNEYPVNELERDSELVKDLEADGLEVNRFHGDMALEPNQVKNKQGDPYRVFTPYKKAWIEVHKTAPIEPLKEPEKQSLDIKEQTTDDFSEEYREDLWPPGEKAALERVDRFLGKVDQYKSKRDIPSVSGTSCISPYLTIGAISAKQCIHALLEHYEGDEQKLYGNTWFSELVWREFYRQILIDNPQITKHKAFNLSAKEVWVDNSEAFEAWKEGRTGFPIIDAAMRQLN